METLDLHSTCLPPMAAALPTPALPCPSGPTCPQGGAGNCRALAMLSTPPCSMQVWEWWAEKKWESGMTPKEMVGSENARRGGGQKGAAPHCSAMLLQEAQEHELQPGRQPEWRMRISKQRFSGK